MVVTLVYLAYQVRQNTNALRAASRQEVVAGMRQHVALRLAHPSGAYVAGLRRFPDLPEEEREEFSMLIGDLALFMQGAFALHESGTLDDETWRAYLDFFASALATPGGAAWWELIGRPIYVNRMVKAVDARLSEGDVFDALALFEELSPTA